MRDMGRRVRGRRAGQPVGTSPALRRNDRSVQSSGGISADFLDQVERFGGTPELMARLRSHAQPAESNVEAPVVDVNRAGVAGAVTGRRSARRTLASEGDSTISRRTGVQTIADTDVDGRPSTPGTSGLRPSARLGRGRYRLAWERHYRYAVIASDLLANALGLLVSGTALGTQVGADNRWRLTVSAVITVLTMCGALVASKAWRYDVLSQGSEEFRQLGKSLLAADVVLALVSLAIDDGAGRAWVFLVLPMITVLAIVQRYVLRRYLYRRRRVGQCLLPVLAAGSAENVYDLIQRARKAPHLGWRVDAVCTVDGRAGTGNRIAGVPVVGSLAEVGEHVRRGGYRIVGITADSYWTPSRLQRLAWDLESGNAEMIVAPALMDVAGGRMSFSTLLGTPMLRIPPPALTGTRRAVKAIFDRVAASVLLVALAPLLLVIGAVIKLNSQGPALYRQERVGKNGKPFTMFKFRTMVGTAEAARIRTRLATETSGPLFKLREDPRITKVGIWLRRYSLDELPQLWNVITGAMSLVGPRPPLPQETTTYGLDVRRRLLIKPGMTGLWQVSGRSDLSWDESVRLDLRYVEDWSLALDVVILWKTIHAVLSGEGAY